MLRQKIVIIPITIGMTFAWSAVRAERPVLSTYGTPGLVDLPSARSLPDGHLAFSSAVLSGSVRNAATFQVLPRVHGTFRYSIIQDFADNNRTDPLALLFDFQLFDRSFDIQVKLLDEARNGVDVAVGLRDFLGTGIFSSEYVVATKSVRDDVTLTAGLGWGRIAGRDSFTNPLGIISEEFETRSTRDFETGGQVETAGWFRGDASVFAGINWDLNDNTSVQLEYSPDLYETELRFSEFTLDGPVNAAIQYRFDNDATLRAFTIGGSIFGAQLSFFLDPSTRVAPSGTELGPEPIRARDSLAAASWDRGASDQIIADLSRRLADDGLRLDDLQIAGQAATLYVENLRWDVEAQAAGRAARVMANTLPAQVETFTIVFQENGLPLSSVTTARADLEELQYDYDASWRTLSRARIEGGGVSGEAPARLEYSLTPYLALSFFDPQSPIRADIGPQFDVSYQAAPGLSVMGRFRYPLAGNLGDSERESDSVIQRVRSEAFLYAREADFEINNLSAEYLWRPGDDLFARVSAGYLENMYGGVSTELLWRPIDSRLAVGGELNYVKQRDFDMLLGFQDYEVLTGHASVYYDIGNGFHAQVDAGRYLAGDWGGTFRLQREFNNNVKIGGYFTLTDVPFDEFGEGSFDKGIEIEFPLSWFTGKPSRLAVKETIQPLLRDGGARLHVDNRLYPLSRDYGGPELSDGWGRYLR